MDPAVFITMLGTAVAALFSTIILLVRLMTSRAEKSEREWRELYISKDAELSDERKETAADARETAASLRELAAIVRGLPDLAAFLNSLPKRRDDYATHERRGGT